MISKMFDASRGGLAFIETMPTLGQVKEFQSVCLQQLHQIVELVLSRDILAFWETWSNSCKRHRSQQR